MTKDGLELPVQVGGRALLDGGQQAPEDERAPSGRSPTARTAAAARSGSLPAALKVAFRTGGVAGMFTVGLGLLGATIIILLFQNTSSAILVGFGFGGSLLALFLRVGGGIFTKAADVGADLVGKVEAGIPEDDPRNPATIADNVGDNVGDCAGMASDLFESYEVTLVAAIILGVPAFASIGAEPVLGLIFPVAARALGVLASIVRIYSVRARDTDTSALKPINRGFLVAGSLTVLGTLLVALLYVGNGEYNEGWKVFGAVVSGLVLAQVASKLTEYFTSTEDAPVREIAEATRTGPATTVLSGISSGLESSVWAIVAIAGSLGVAILLGGDNLQFVFYLVALTGMGMLATTGVIVAEDTFGPVADNAAGIAEMSYTEKPDHGKVIDICTTASLRELTTPALLAVLTPVIVGFGINYFALGAFLGAVILTGQLMANFLSNAGGAWDNAKKYIEDGNEGGKGSEAHKAAVIGDTVGDPFKDTAGPALNPLIKVMNLVALLILPAVIALQDDTVARLVITFGSLAILGAAIAFSKRGGAGLVTADAAPAEVAGR